MKDSDNYWSNAYRSYRRPTVTRDIDEDFAALIAAQDASWVAECERVSAAARDAGL